MLALPPRVACTALTFLRRMPPDELPPEVGGQPAGMAVAGCYVPQRAAMPVNISTELPLPNPNRHVQRLAAACVFLAAKVEEAAVRTNDMLNAVAAWQGGPAAATDAAALARSPCLVGEAYQAAKRQLVLDEQVLLRRLRFEIGVEQPHRHLYALAHCWAAPAAALRLATCLLNDCVARCPSYGGAEMPPATAAAAALHLGGQLCGQPVQPHGWWRAAGITDQALAGACNALLDMLASA